jgi:hypothetical protein
MAFPFTKAQWRQTLINAKGAIKGANNPNGVPDLSGSFLSLPQVHDLDEATELLKWYQADVDALIGTFPFLGVTPTNKWSQALVDALNTPQENNHIESGFALNPSGSPVVPGDYSGDYTAGSTGTRRLTCVPEGITFLTRSSILGPVVENIHNGLREHCIDTYAGGFPGTSWPVELLNFGSPAFIVFRENTGSGVQTYTSISTDQALKNTVMRAGFSSWSWSWSMSGASSSFSGSASGTFTHLPFEDISPDSLIAWESDVLSIDGDTVLSEGGRAESPEHNFVEGDEFISAESEVSFS